MSVTANPKWPYLGRVRGEELSNVLGKQRGVSHPPLKKYVQPPKFGSKEIISLKKHSRDKKINESS